MVGAFTSGQTAGVANKSVGTSVKDQRMLSWSRDAVRAKAHFLRFLFPSLFHQSFVEFLAAYGFMK